MPFRDKILICLVPYLLAGILWFSLAGQAFSDWEDKDKQISEKSKEAVDLKTRLFQLTKLQKEKIALQGDIDRLRSAVPKSANLDILLIDLEKMCLSSGMDLVSIEKPQEKKGAVAEKNENQAKVAPAKRRGKHGGKGAQEKPKAASPEEEVGLSKVELNTQVIGSYPALIELMKKLEAYQRVIGVNHVEIQVPQEETKKISGDPADRLKISFLVTAYYLP